MSWTVGRTEGPIMVNRYWSNILTQQKYSNISASQDGTHAVLQSPLLVLCLSLAY